MFRETWSPMLRYTRLHMWICLYVNIQSMRLYKLSKSLCWQFLDLCPISSHISSIHDLGNFGFWISNFILPTIYMVPNVPTSCYISYQKIFMITNSSLLLNFSLESIVASLRFAGDTVDFGCCLGIEMLEGTYKGSPYSSGVFQPDLSDA